MTKVLGLFTCYNRKEKTENCLRELRRGNPKLSFSFIAVDDKSTDGTRELLGRYKDLEVIETEGNAYYSGGMRQAIAAAKVCCDSYDWILLLNDDVEFYPGTIERLIRYAGHEIMVGATCDREGNLSYGGVIKESSFRPAFGKRMSGKEKVYCDTFNANCVLIPGDVFKRLPNIDTKYTHSLGDYDYGLTAGRMGVKIAVSDFFVGICNDNPVQGTWQDVTLSRKERMKKKESPKGLPRREWFYFIRKNYGWFSACVNSVIPYIKIIIKRA